jgi:hypothetical protein
MFEIIGLIMSCTGLYMLVSIWKSLLGPRKADLVPKLKRFEIKNRSNTNLFFQGETLGRKTNYEVEYMGRSKTTIVVEKLFIMLDKHWAEVGVIESKIEADGVIITISNDPCYEFDLRQDSTMIRIDNDPYWKVNLSCNLPQIKVVPIMLWGGEPTELDILPEGTFKGVSMFVTPNNQQIDFRNNTTGRVDNLHYSVSRVSYNECKVTVTIFKQLTGGDIQGVKKPFVASSEADNSATSKD